MLFRASFIVFLRICVDKTSISSLLPTAGFSRVSMNSDTLTSAVGCIASYDRKSLNSRCPQVHLLGNDQLVTVVSAAGSGFIQFSGNAVTRWRPDATCDSDGCYLYVRDLDSGEFWSAGYQPTTKEPDEYSVEFYPGTARFARRDGEIRTNLSVYLSTDESIEFRTLTVTNLGRTAKRLELTSYAEIVLQSAEADAGHLAYSKLFVETSRDETGTLYARRRPRETSAKSLHACHFVVGPNDETSFETDRARFIGRGNTVSNPTALQYSDLLFGGIGSVLDPIFSLRQVVEVHPGESKTLTFAIAVAEDLDILRHISERYQSDKSVALAQAKAEQQEGISRFDNDRIPRLLEAASAKLYRTPSQKPDGEVVTTLCNLDAENEDEICDFLAHFGMRYDQEAGVKLESLLEAPNVVDSDDDSGKQSFQIAEDDSIAIADQAEELIYENGYGGFSADGTEYVIRIRPGENEQSPLPPMPWVNIVSNEQIGFIASESGAGYTWAENSRLNRLTPWFNDPVIDPHGEVIYLRDEDKGTFWTATPGPIRQPVEYEVRHGIGYSRYRHASNGLQHDLCIFVPECDPLKINWLKLTNTSGRPRRISLFSYLQWELNDGSQSARTSIVSSRDHECNLLFAQNENRGVFSQNVSFVGLITPPSTNESQWTCDRFEFLGHHGRLDSPRALCRAIELSGRVGQGFDQCAVTKAGFTIEPGETVEFAVLIGEAPSKADALHLIDSYQSPPSWDSSLNDVCAAWRERLDAVQIETPSSAINLMVNHWLPYQNLSCRVWGRSSHYQSGGAYGYRDQLQDAAALIHHMPELTRKQIIRHASHQFVEGDVMHWWHPPESLGIRTMFSDDLLWLPLFAAEYFRATGDQSLWHEEVPFLHGAELPAGEAEIMLTPSQANNTATLYEHCCRALDRGLTTGRHGLPLMGCGDWNDGMNRVGIGGTGESVWMGFFIDFILGKMLPVCEQFDDQQRFQRYQSYREQLRSALHDAGWDGGWYRRAYFDDGTPLGTAAADECQIDALVQAWAVLSGADTTARAETAMDAAAERLVDEEAGLIQLLDPPFDKMPNDPGYIKGYLPGVRENGGQYTHGVLWFVRAMAELGRGSQAVRLLEMISPINHTRTPDEVATYKAEAYVIAADVYSQAPHAGRAGWSWYTGSAGWMWRVAVESILGVQLVGGKMLRVDPRISEDWLECRVCYRLADRKTSYDILIRNPNRRELGVRQCEVDGQLLDITDGVASIPLAFDGKTHQAIVTL